MRRINCRENLVGVAGFEPATPSSRTRCATRLRYTPKAGLIAAPIRCRKFAAACLGESPASRSLAQIVEQPDAILGLAEPPGLRLEFVRADPAIVEGDLLRRR